MAIILITKENEEKFKTPERIYGGGGRPRRLWMKEFCKRSPKKSNFQGFAHVDLSKLIKYGKYKVEVK